MNATSRVLLVALLCTAAVACSKKVKEAPPLADTASPTSIHSATSDGMHGPGDLDADARTR